MKLALHAHKLTVAITRATREHGAPNSFSFIELHRYYGGPPPMVAGRATRLIRGWANLAGVWFGERVNVIEGAEVFPCPRIP